VVEVLIPDFQGNIDDINTVVQAGPEVVAHNIETTKTLTPKVRDSRATYDQSLAVLRSIKELRPTTHTKSSIMLGFGENHGDVLSTMKDLRNVNVDILTLGQYLRPTKAHLPVVEYVDPHVFQQYKQAAIDLGFLYVAAGPLVRSSYRAGEFFVEALIRKNSRALSS
jgi:lipoic acid synthetase